MWTFLFIASVFRLAVGLPQAATTTHLASASYSDVLSGLSSYTYTVSTAVATATASTSAPLPKFSLFPKQPSCNLTLFCPGYGILDAIQLSGIYTDSKTFVDKPALYNTSTVLAAWARVNSTGNYTAEQVIQFVDANFGGEGTNVLQANLTDYVDDAPFLANVTGSTIVRGWLQIVHSYWNRLARINNNTAICDGCENTQLPLNYSYIIPGSRFREQYYWDNFFEIQGLLRSGLFDVTNDTLHNFFDELFAYGFVPNGGRVYYLNRSQPPLLAQMLYSYSTYTNDTSILRRGLQALEVEMRYWDQTQTILVNSTSGVSHNVTRYLVNNTAPRPEGYVPDYQTVIGEPGENATMFNQSRIDQLLADLASGAESGEDYSAARWTTAPLANLSDNDPALRTLDIQNIVPVDLNSILYQDYVSIAKMYNTTGNSTRSAYWSQRAAQRRVAILDLHWDASRSVFNDYNLTSRNTSRNWTPASLAPFWSGIFPQQLLANESALQRYFAPLAFSVAFYNGTIPASFLDTGLQWDFPSTWPPHTYIAISALLNVPRNVSNGTLSAFATRAIGNYSESQIGVNMSSLPGQPIGESKSMNRTMPASSDVTILENVGNLTGTMGWRDGMVLALANRYTASFFCSWYATGGTIPALLAQLSPQQLNVSMSINSTGHMFEKGDASNINAAGFGGEYTVQEGFGWSNGVAIWIGANFGANLSTPACPPVVVNQTMPTRLRRRDYL